VWLVPFAETEAYDAASMNLAWMAEPGEWYHVLQHDDKWALAYADSDPAAGTVWISLDGRVQLTPGDAPHSPA
jgi:hypothetical protein